MQRIYYVLINNKIIQKRIKNIAIIERPNLPLWKYAPAI
jgi:hypothetical protein